MSKKTIVFTGGGSAGHVTPNIAIINEMDHSKWNINYIGSKNGIEKELIEKIHIPYYEISSGKLRRYIDFENVVDTFRVVKGCLEARRILKKIKPALIFSKGGFVSVPVIIAAKSLKIPILIHESDMTPGLANKISQRFATKIFTSFEETVKYFPTEKAVVIGSPIRNEILMGSKSKGMQLLGFDGRLPILTIMGGSLGAKKINDTVRSSLKPLLEKYRIVHLCGKGNKDETLMDVPGYKQFEYVHGELSDILAATDIVLTRGGSNAIFEFLALKIPMLIIPLSKKQSRGDQILNAKSFEEKGYSLTLEEEDLNIDSLASHLEQLIRNKEKFKKTMERSVQGNALRIILKHIEAR
ncbi:undecaprenyldiphospho-muramoylpentapeptide beta-N-acetylglucosaminyltransferase [Neobacillus sp. PS3-34]|uniref:undecaprenyldiphospho-muramoylpentapeptide beta-N-acetylglucosaminyltransferase n=1 Tax=Neobacillus sp. PS3-34 TaxID=3070678 RepID=UPI0027E1BE50|nr:undecaprenyldiphospho-muramoylpentapeptide beta-N-acetylglucosaminyltransferase [Neobacillus sp. PS3-34]WML50007.1 undecaprenyldiphospho-muramoylpentapeptide beta-N-acetylglucosaminyltransferase [Neobacillus sp. PS3-34]